MCELVYARKCMIHEHFYFRLGDYENSSKFEIIIVIAGNITHLKVMTFNIDLINPNIEHGC